MSGFFTLAAIHALAVISPGPDFAIIAKHSLGSSRKAGVATAVGLALGILVHVTYCLLGIGLIISKSIVLFSTLKYMGAAYLCYIGWNALRSAPPQQQQYAERKTISVPAAIRMGFLCNVLNPKATVFFLALFTQVISPATPLAVQAGYGLYMSFATFVWFAFLSCIFSVASVRQLLHSYQASIERCMGAVLIALGLKVAFAHQHS